LKCIQQEVPRLFTVDFIKGIISMGFDREKTQKCVSPLRFLGEKKSKLKKKI
jgi:hypothetical protein